MLRELHIRHLGVIDEARIEPHPGLTVVTGETGTGKTMVVSSLGLVLGGKADAALVRAGQDSAVVEADLELAPAHPALARAAEAGAEVDGGELLLVRSVAAGGRSRAHVGGRRVPASLLAELAEDLVAVHGQADQWRLTRPVQHRAVVDDVGGRPLAQERAEVAALVATWRARQDELAALVDDERTRVQEIDHLTYQLEQIDAVDPQPDELEALTADEERLAHAEQLQSATGLAHRRLSDPDALDGGDAVALVAEAAKEVSAVAEHDPQLRGLHERITEVGVLVAELAADLGSYATDIEVDPARLARTQERRAAITDLLRRYGDDVPAVLAHRDDARRRLARLAGADERIVELREEVGRLADELTQAVDRLTATRQTVAARLATEVAAELAALGMPRAELEIEVAQEEADDEAALVTRDGRRLRVTPEGADRVEIRVAVNPGTPPRSVARAASGGELSRIMLAIEVATAGAAHDPSASETPADEEADVTATRPTFVFDEVDAGVGGKAGIDVGARLARLARSSQVIVVTHLAQVAAHADRHLVVRKDDDGQVTSSDITPVEGAERLRELARMMGGEDSEAGLDHARELLEASQDRAAAATRAHA